MNSSGIIDIIHQIRRIQETNKLVLFVGAGVSKNVEGMVDWSELVDIYARAIHYSKCKNCRSRSKCKNCGKISRDYTLDEYLKIPQYYFNKHPRKYYEILRDSFPKEVVTNAPLSDAILSINPSHIITTNYDKLIESSESAYSCQYETIIHDYDLLKTKKNKYIVKMHGDLDDINTIILKEQDYLEYSETHVLIELFIKSLLVDHTFLFLGYSLNDYNVKLLVSWINYLRAQNPSIKTDMKAGYIVQDDNQIVPDTIRYYAKNGIQVLNIRKLHLLDSIPSELTDDKGKRLYTFLRVIRNPHLERQVFGKDAMDEVVLFLKDKMVYDHTALLSLLHVFRYDRKGELLVVLSEDQYDWLTNYMSMSTELACMLKERFLNVGITSIRGYKANSEVSFEIGRETYSDVYSDEMFNTYIQDDYILLLKLCDKERNPIKKEFYRHFVMGYDKTSIISETPHLFETLSTPDKIACLHNEAARKAKVYWSVLFDSDSVKHYIDNISESREKELYRGYSDIYSGNDNKLRVMNDSLSKLKKNVQNIPTSFYSDGPLGELYRIRNVALSQYFFYMRAHIYMQNFDYAKGFFRPYIEGILCGNSTDMEKQGFFMGETLNYDKFCVSKVDFDIISKCISPRELNMLLKEYKVKTFCTDSDTIDHLVKCFINLSKSVIDLNAWGNRDSSLKALCNLAQILIRVDIPNSYLSKIRKAVSKLFSYSEYNNRFWRIDPDLESMIETMSELVTLLKPCPSVPCINSILSAPDFYDAVRISNLPNSRRIIEFFINQSDDVSHIIDSQTSLCRKTLLLRLMYRKLSETNIRKYKTFLSEHIFQLDKSTLYTFIFAKWIKPKKMFVDHLLSEIVLLGKQDGPITVSPNPVDEKMEMALILHMTGYIKSLEPLQDFCQLYPVLDFLIHPDIFDYSKVDFSNYMWINVARKEKYMSLIVKHKEEIKPRIKERVRRGDATETEKKILYSRLLSKDEIWRLGEP